jgi:hypothetical protein
VSRGGGGNRANGLSAGEGLGGLKALGVRDLTYRTSFLAQTVTPVGQPTAVTLQVRQQQ